MRAELGCREAETAVLGAAMLAPTQAASVLAGLTADDFTDPRYRDVFDAVRALLGDAAAPDPVAVLGQLRRTGVLSATTDRSAGVLIHDLITSCPVPAGAREYRRIVVEHAYRRTARTAFERIAQAAESAPLSTCQQVVADGLRTTIAALRRCDRSEGHK